MKKRVCYFGAEASYTRLIGPSGDAVWSSDQPGQPDDAIDFETVRRRVSEAGAWVASQTAGARRLDLVCIGVEECLCSWISAPSPDPQVVAAAVRQREGDWGDAAAVVSVQPLYKKKAGESVGLGARVASLRAREKNAAPRLATPLAVIEMRDAAARLWLDDLDARGVHVSAVTTLWHAMALAWGDGAPQSTAPKASGNGHGVPETPVTAIAIVNGRGHVTWAWARGRDLLAGGVSSVAASSARGAIESGAEDVAAPVAAAPVEETCGRLVLDWLTWSAHIGQAPDRIVIVGEGAGALSDSLGRLWPSAPTNTIEEADALGATLRLLSERIEETPAPAADPRRCLVQLSYRPGRQHRRLFTWTAAAMALLAVGVAGIGFKARQWQQDLQASASELSSETRQRVAVVAPEAAGGRATVFMLEQLRGVLADARRVGADLEEPPAPAPILDELFRFSRAIATLEGSGARVDRFQFSRGSISALIVVEDLGTAESVRNRISDNSRHIRWTGTISGGSPNVRLQMQGDWRNIQ